MKKSIVAGLVVLALIVLISPGLIGKLAERSVDEQLRWAAEENEDIVVTSEVFDRGWFSSEGRHRVSLGRLAEATGLGSLGVPTGDADGPTLVIETRLDHGLIPVSSMSREDGSLMPGLGRAVSTLTLDYGDGERVELPGRVFSRIGLGGGLHSTYELEPGASEALTWGRASIEIDANAARRSFAADGGLASVAIVDGEDSINLGDLDLDVDLVKVEQGFNVGDIDVAFSTLAVGRANGEDLYVGPASLSAASEISDGRVNSVNRLDVTLSGLEPVGDVGWQVAADVTGLDADAFGALNRRLDTLPDSVTPETALGLAADELEALFAAGVNVDIGTFDVSLPQGTVRSNWHFTLPETDRRAFSWTGALLALEAKGDLAIPIAVFEYAATVNPDVNAALGMGFFRKSGDDYVMTAEYRKGLLTINGAPMPVPLPGG